MSGPDKFILLAEDYPCVAELVLHVLRRAPSPPPVVHVQDGVEALEYLRRQEAAGAAAPAVVLLDLKMPRLDGLEVLRQIKSDEALRTTPVVMLTSSHDERDIRTSYALGANAYVVKPVEFQRFAAVIGHLERFWMEVNRPPRVPGPLAALDSR